MNERPLPVPSVLTRPYWDGARRHQLWLQRCVDCGTYLFYPRYLCTSCGADTLAWEQVSGRGAVFTYTVAHKPTHPAFVERVPFVIAVVELHEGPKLTTNVVGCAPSEVAIGMEVRACYDDEEQVTLVNFEPEEHNR